MNAAKADQMLASVLDASSVEMERHRAELRGSPLRDIFNGPSVPNKSEPTPQSADHDTQRAIFAAMALDWTVVGCL